MNITLYLKHFTKCLFILLAFMEQWIKIPFRLLYKVYFLVVFYITLALLYPFFSYLLADRSRWSRAFIWMKRWGALLRFLTGICVKTNTEHAFPNPPYVVVCNHQSYIDTILMYACVPDYFVFLGKAELSKWPLFHVFFTKGMNILVDRSSVRRSHGAFQDAHNRLTLGRSVVLFPEGGIPPNTPELARFKHGAFRLAIEHQVPIVPITIVNSWKHFNSNALLTGEGGPGSYKVIVHPAIHTTGKSNQDLVNLRNQAFEVINKPLLNDGSKR